jgi:acyl dehydratase
VTEQRWFEDLSPGDAFTAPDVTVTMEDFQAFAALTGDAHPMHYDEDFSQQTRFGRPVAHGLHLLGLTALGSTTLTEAMRDTVIAFLRVEARFMKPVHPGDTLERRIEVTGKAERNPGQGFVFMRATLRRGEESVLEADHTYLFKRRP